MLHGVFVLVLRKNKLVLFETSYKEYSSIKYIKENEDQNILKTLKYTRILNNILMVALLREKGNREMNGCKHDDFLCYYLYISYLLVTGVGTTKHQAWEEITDNHNKRSQGSSMIT